MAIIEFISNFKDQLYVFLCSMLPVLELRAGVPLGATLGLDVFQTFFLAVLGNLLPIPFILIFIKKILEWMRGSRIKILNKISNKLYQKAEKRSEKVNKFEVFGLFLFVAIPLPMTGAWTGALIAGLFEMRFSKSFISIILGVITSGIIMCLASFGIVKFLSIFA